MRRIKLQPGYRLTLEDGRLGGMRPSELFVGEMWVGLWSKHNHARWGAKWANGEFYRAHGGLVRPFRVGEVITMKVEVVGAGDWTVEASFERDERMVDRGIEWVGCRGIAPKKTTCEKSFVVGSEFKRRHVVGEDMGYWSSKREDLTYYVRWESATALRVTDCSYSNNALACGGAWKGSFRPGQRVTLTVEVTGNGGWRASARYKTHR